MSGSLKRNITSLNLGSLYAMLLLDVIGLLQNSWGLLGVHLLVYNS